MAKNEFDLNLPYILPHDIEAEKSVLGGIITNNRAMAAVSELLSVYDFYSESHQMIFKTIISLLSEDIPINLMTLSNQLKDRNWLDKVGGEVYLKGLVSNISSVANIVHATKIVKERSISRALVIAAVEIIKKANDTSADVGILLDESECAIFKILRLQGLSAFFQIETLVKRTLETIEMRCTTDQWYKRLTTGFERIDELTSGLHRGDLIVVAGRPGSGKTAFAMNIAQRAAMMMRYATVAVFSLAMTSEQLTLRLLAAIAKVDSNLIRQGAIGEAEWTKLRTASRRLSGIPLFIDDTPSMTILEIKAKVRRLASEHGISLVIVDNLQLIHSNITIESEDKKISEISRSLKAFAKELDVPIIVLFQLTRSVDDGTATEPKIADFKELYEIEQDADVIFFIHRDEIHKKSGDNLKKGKAEIIIAKQRNGPVGTVKLGFIEEYASFECL